MLLTTKEKHMNTRVRKVFLPLFCVGFLAFTAVAANADPVTFSTTGVFSISGTNVVNFSSVNGTTTITFNGTTINAGNFTPNQLKSIPLPAPKEPK